MYAMQYEITLPADYDMGIIRRRVATKGKLLDNFSGLGLKAYLIRERGSDSDVNQYAPFYLWAATGGMGRFLWGGGGFANIVDFVGRIPVRHWTGVSCLKGPAAEAPPSAATRLIEPMRSGDPTAIVEEALARLRRDARHPLVHTTALAVDPQRWTLLRFTLWRERNADAAGTPYQVLHLSTPHLDEIAEAA